MLFLFLISISAVVGHAEHAGPAVESTSVLYQIFLLHDWIHPVFFILLIYSCYYFRFFFGRNISHQPRTCLADCSSCYKPEDKLKQYHRYIFWGTLILTFIHFGEIIPSLAIISNLSGLGLSILVSESLYLISAFLFLSTCYHFRYFVERLAKKRLVSYNVYNSLTSLNRHHGLFFWTTIIAVAIRFTLVAVDTGSILQAIPGMF